MAVMLNARSRVRKSECPYGCCVSSHLAQKNGKRKARRAERARIKAETRDIARRYV